MLSFVATDIGGERRVLPAPLSVSLRLEEDVPADDLYVTFPATDGSELKEITVYDGDRVVFTGVIDEEEHLYTPSGIRLRLSARSAAAHLLDNEAVPCTYDHPSAKMIYERHVRGYGIRFGDADDATCFGELSVIKGMSRWAVVKSFCAACYSTIPKVTADGVLYMRGLPRGGTVTFGEGGVRYTALNETLRRCAELSRVNVKISEDGGYSYPVENMDAIRRGIRRERCLNAMLTETPIRSADVMLRQSREKAYALTLRCPGRLLTVLGWDAALADIKLGERGGLSVTALHYQMNAKGEFTTVKLKRRNT